MKRILKLLTALLMVAVVVSNTSCKKNTDNNSNNGGGTNPTDVDYSIDVDFLPKEETNGEVAPRLMANINDELVMIELRPSVDSLVETVLLLGPDNYAMMLCGNDQLMICAEYDMETYTPSDEVLLVTAMADTALLLTKCVMDWNTNAITTGDMMILPVHDFDRDKRGTNDIDGDIRKYFFNTFVKPLAASFEEVEHFCNMLGVPAAGVFASIRLIITTELTEMLFSDDPENTYANTTHQFTSSIASQVSSYVLNLFPQKYHAIVSRILAAIAWHNDGGHGEVSNYQGYNNGGEWSNYGSVFSQAYKLTTASTSIVPTPIYIVNLNVSNITKNSAFLKGSFRFGSSSSITPVEMGYVFSVSGGPDNTEEDMDFNGLTLTDLQKATKYSACAYVKSLMGDVVYSPAVTFWTLGFEAFPNSLSFPSDGDTKYVSLSYSEDDITSWEVSSSPQWCSVTKDGDKMLSVTVGETTESRSGAITVTGYSRAQGSITENISVTQDGSGYFTGTPFNNTKWNAPITYVINGSQLYRWSEWHYLPNGNSYYTYYTENHTDSGSFSSTTSPSFKDNKIIYSAYDAYEFKEDSIIFRMTVDGHEFITRCRNNIAIDIHDSYYMFGTLDENYDGTITMSRYFIDNNTFCIKEVASFTYRESNSNNSWKVENNQHESITEFKILSNNQCAIYFNSTDHMTSNYGSEYTGCIQGDLTQTYNGTGTYEYGGKNYNANQGTNQHNSMLLPMIPARKQK